MQEGVLGESTDGFQRPFLQTSASSAPGGSPGAATSAFVSAPEGTQRFDKANTFDYFGDYEPSDDEDNIGMKLQDLTNDIETLHLGSFHGKSAVAGLTNAVLERDGIKSEVPTGAFELNSKHVRPEFWKLNEVGARI